MINTSVDISQKHTHVMHIIPWRIASFSQLIKAFVVFTNVHFYSLIPSLSTTKWKATFLTVISDLCPYFHDALYD